MSGQISRGFFTRIKTKWNAFFKKTESPREIQERNDLYKIALAVTYNDVRQKATTKSIVGAQSSASSQQKHYPRTNHQREELEKFYDEASSILDKKEIYESSIRELRTEVQALIRPQLLAILNTCKITEKALPSTTELHSESQEYVLQSEQNKLKCKEILYEEQCQTLDMLDSLNSDRESRGENDSSGHKTFEKQTNQTIFFNKKNHAIQSIASFYSWEHFYFDSSSENARVDATGADEFGYIESTDDQVKNSIRYYQMLNLSRSALIRQKIGYSTIALKSTIPSGGRGIYIDGLAPAGSIVAFFPGDVWPKEYLVNFNSLSSYFEKDPRMHLSMRYDDILIDSRKAPYTVLDDKHSNAFAVAHIANHPSKLDKPNCSTLAIDFFEDMKLNETEIIKFVPNTYKKKPMMLGPKALDTNEIYMHSMGLMARRDLQNEEVFYDYRLTNGKGVSYPKWYSSNEEELKNLVY